MDYNRVDDCKTTSKISGISYFVLIYSLFVEFVGQQLNIFIVHVWTQLEVPVIELLKGSPFFLLAYLHQIFYVLDQVQQLLIVFIVVKRNYWNPVLQLVEVWISRVIHQKDVLQVPVLQSPKVLDIDSFFSLPTLSSEQSMTH